MYVGWVSDSNGAVTMLDTWGGSADNNPTLDTHSDALNVRGSQVI